MIDLGSGIAIAGVCISGGAVVITAIRVFGGKSNGKNRAFTCAEHSGMLESLRGIKSTQDRQEKWLGEISGDIKSILKNGRQ